MPDEYGKKLKRRRQFLSDLSALFEKYEASIDVQRMCRGYDDWYVDLVFEIDGLDGYCGEISFASVVDTSDINKLYKSADKEVLDWQSNHPQ